MSERLRSQRCEALQRGRAPRAAHTVEQLAEPIPICVHRWELVNLPRLQQLQQAGSVTVAFVESGS
jgi:hypothetical protein